MQNKKQLKDKKFFLLDKDGTLSLGTKILNGTKDFIKALRENDIKFAVATNNSSKTAQGHLKSLNNMGLDFNMDNIIVSLDVAIDYIENQDIRKVFWVANNEVSDYLSNFFIFDQDDPEVILVTFDTDLSYSKLIDLVNLLHKNIPYYVTHSDIVCPTEKYDIPDVGSFIKMIEMTTNRSPDISFGKPSQYYIDYIKKKYNVEEKDMVIVGDRLYTDIKLAEDNEITSVLVLSGETNIDMYNKGDVRADLVIDGVNLIFNKVGKA